MEHFPGFAEVGQLCAKCIKDLLQVLAASADLVVGVCASLYNLNLVSLVVKLLLKEVDLAQKSGGVNVASIGINWRQSLDLTLKSVNIVLVLVEFAIMTINSFLKSRESNFMVVDTVGILLNFIIQFSESSF